MDALMAALVAAAVAQIGDRTAWLAAIFADRYRRPGLVILIAAIAIALASAGATVTGMLVAPRLTTEARQFLLAVALFAQGIVLATPQKAPDRLESWRLGAAATSLAGLGAAAFGAGIQFVVVALAARSALPWLAAVGATIGSLAAVVPAALLGESAWRALPLKPIRIGAATLFVITGLILALGAIGLI